MKSTKLFICFALIAFAIYGVNGALEKCNALILEGDGDVGAYQAGVVQGLLKTLKAGEEWDVISGNGVGSFNAAGLAQFQVGNENQMSSWINNIWTPLQKGDLYQSWVPGGLTQGILYQQAVFDSTNLTNFVNNKIAFLPQRPFISVSCDANTGNVHRVDEKSDLNSIRQNIIATMSTAFFFNAHVIKVADTNSLQFEGSACQKADISGAIQKCQSLGAPDNGIHLTIVYNNNNVMTQFSQKAPALEAQNRKNKIQEIRRMYRELILAQQYYPDVNFDHVIMPSKTWMPAQYPYSYKKEVVSDMLATGSADAEAELAKGAGETFNAVLSKAQEQQKIDNDL